MRNRAYFCGGPGNKRDVTRFDRLSDEERQWTNDYAAKLYDGSRTVARCWREALDIVTSPDIVRGEP